MHYSVGNKVITSQWYLRLYYFVRFNVGWTVKFLELNKLWCRHASTDMTQLKLCCLSDLQFDTIYKILIVVLIKYKISLNYYHLHQWIFCISLLNTKLCPILINLVNGLHKFKVRQLRTNDMLVIQNAYRLEFIKKWWMTLVLIGRHYLRNHIRKHESPLVRGIYLNYDIFVSL